METATPTTSKNPWLSAILVSLVILGVVSGASYWSVSSVRVFTDKVEIVAPVVALAPQSSGVLEELFVHEGDVVTADRLVARVGNELIKAKVDGIVSSANANLGKLINRGETVVTMYDPRELRVVAHIPEDKGLADIRVGQVAVFTVDTFGSKEYQGVVDEIAPSSRSGDVVFNISDKREVKDFDVKIRYNAASSSEIKNGMSAKVWIYKQ